MGTATASTSCSEWPEVTLSVLSLPATYVAIPDVPVRLNGRRQRASDFRTTRQGECHGLRRRG
jgi:hypothetical protein